MKRVGAFSQPRVVARLLTVAVGLLTWICGWSPLGPLSSLCGPGQGCLWVQGMDGAALRTGLGVGGDKGDTESERRAWAQGVLTNSGDLRQRCHLALWEKEPSCTLPFSLHEALRVL